MTACGSRPDVAIIGAGPAGAMAALTLARRGADVALIDKAAFPRFKVCGCCLNAEGLRILDRAGLHSAIAALGGEPLTRMIVAAEGQRAAWALPPGLAISRRALDAALVTEATRAGAHLIERATAQWSGTGVHGQRLTLRIRPGDSGAADREILEIEAGRVLVADGLGGTFLKSVPGFGAVVRRDARMGFGTVLDDRAAGRAPDYEPGYKPGTVYMAHGRRGYCGVVRLEDGALAVAAAADRAFVQQCGGPGSAAARLIDEAGLSPLADLAHEPWRGTPALTQRWRPLATRDLFVLGDAGGYVEPFTGEGMAWALASGEAVARHAWPEEGRRDQPAEWTRAQRRLLARRQRRCHRVARALRHPTLVRCALRMLGRWPGLGAVLARRVSDPHG